MQEGVNEKKYIYLSRYSHIGPYIILCVHHVPLYIINNNTIVVNCLNWLVIKQYNKQTTATAV